jgi:hypothetical protein
MRIPLLVALPLLAGCIPLTPAEREAEQQRRAESDRALRRQHMQERGGITETEYEVLSRRTGETPATSGGIPRVPTTQELERKVESQR